jgi:hypothetical protein
MKNSKRIGKGCGAAEKCQTIKASRQPKKGWRELYGNYVVEDKLNRLRLTESFMA